MLFKETVFSQNKKVERELEFSDSKAAHEYADRLFMLNNDAVSMHSDWAGPEVKIYFIASKKVGNGIAAAKLFYKLEPSSSTTKLDV